MTLEILFNIDFDVCRSSTIDVHMDIVTMK